MCLFLEKKKKKKKTKKNKTKVKSLFGHRVQKLLLKKNVKIVV